MTWLVGKWHTLGQPTDHSSFQSLLARLVGVLYTLTFWPPNTSTPNFWLACNGLLVITRIQANKPVEPTESHADLLIVARTLMQTCGYKIELAFIQGHQDNGTPAVLTRDVWLNVEADKLAKAKVDPSWGAPPITNSQGTNGDVMQEWNELSHSLTWHYEHGLMEKRPKTTGKNASNLQECRLKM